MQSLILTQVTYRISASEEFFKRKMLGQTMIGGGLSIHKIVNNLTLHVWSSSNDGAEMNKFSKNPSVLRNNSGKYILGYIYELKTDHLSFCVLFIFRGC